jgi:hypothetical protein
VQQTKELAVQTVNVVVIRCLTGGSISLSLLLSWPLFEFHLTEMHDSRRAFVQTRLFLLVEAQHNERVLTKVKHSPVYYTVAMVSADYLHAS